MLAAIVQKIGRFLGNEIIAKIVSAIKAWLKYVKLKKEVKKTVTMRDRNEATDSLNDIMR